jgi:hypothetical protein
VFSGRRWRKRARSPLRVGTAPRAPLQVHQGSRPVQRTAFVPATVGQETVAGGAEVPAGLDEKAHPVRARLRRGGAAVNWMESAALGVLK